MRTYNSKCLFLPFDLMHSAQVQLQPRRWLTDSVRERVPEERHSRLRGVEILEALVEPPLRSFEVGSVFWEQFLATGNIFTHFFTGWGRCAKFGNTDEKSLRQYSQRRQSSKNTVSSLGYAAHDNNKKKTSPNTFCGFPEATFTSFN